MNPNGKAEISDYYTLYPVFHLLMLGNVNVLSVGHEDRIDRKLKIVFGDHMSAITGFPLGKHKQLLLQLKIGPGQIDSVTK